MHTELTFLIDLLLGHKLPMATKKAVSDRLREVEQQLQLPRLTQGNFVAGAQISNQPMVDGRGVQQSASTMAILARNPDLAAQQPASPVIQVAQTPAAMQAMQARNEAIAIATSGKEEKGRTSPRKF